MVQPSTTIAIDQLAGSMLACQTVDAVRDDFHKEVARHGYTSSACRAFVPSPRGVAAHLLFRNWPASRASISDDRGFAAASFVTAEARTRLMPFT